MKHSLKPREIETVLQKRLREQGYKLTSQRLAIITLLSKDMTHPGAADILKKIRKSLPQVSLSTVYYTLDILKKEGLIQELEFYDQDNRYDINISKHINLICKKCGKIETSRRDSLLLIPQIQQKTDFQPVAMRYEYYGYCKECRRKRAG